MYAIDLSYLENMTGGDKEIIIEMVELFLEQTPEHLSAMKKAQEEQNWPQLRAEAHKVKPMFLYVGLTELNKNCKDIEYYARNEENLDSLPEMIEKLTTGYNEVVDSLRNKVSELS